MNLSPDDRDSLIESANGAYSAAMQVSSSHHISQEVAHDIVEKFIATSRYFEDLNVAFRYGWISGRNRAVDICRSRTIEQKYITKAGGYFGLEATQTLDHSTIEILATISSMEEVSDSDREIISLIILGLSVAEIRAITGISSNGSWRNARTRIQKILLRSGIVKQAESGNVTVAIRQDEAV